MSDLLLDVLASYAPLYFTDAIGASPAQASLLGGLMAWSVGWLASKTGLPAAMWLLLAGPLNLALFVPPPTLKRPIMTPYA